MSHLRSPYFSIGERVTRHVTRNLARNSTKSSTSRTSRSEAGKGAGGIPGLIGSHRRLGKRECSTTNNTLTSESQGLVKKETIEDVDSEIASTTALKQSLRRKLKIEYDDEHQVHPSPTLSKPSYGDFVKQEVEESFTPDGDEATKRSKWEPQHWRDQLDNIYEMRKDRDAAVDTMGCDRISDIHAVPQVEYIGLLIFIKKTTRAKLDLVSLIR